MSVDRKIAELYGEHGHEAVTHVLMAAQLLLMAWWDGRAVQQRTKDPDTIADMEAGAQCRAYAALVLSQSFVGLESAFAELGIRPMLTAPMHMDFPHFKIPPAS